MSRKRPGRLECFPAGAGFARVWLTSGTWSRQASSPTREHSNKSPLFSLHPKLYTTMQIQRHFIKIHLIAGWKELPDTLLKPHPSCSSLQRYNSSRSEVQTIRGPSGLSLNYSRSGLGNSSTGRKTEIARLQSFLMGFSDGSVGKESACNAGDTGDLGLIPGSGRSPGGTNVKPLQYSCLENTMGGWGTWGCKESDTTEHNHFL